MLKIAFTFILLFCIASASKASTAHLSEAQVVQIAANFCSQIGQPVSRQPATEFPVHDILPPDMVYWQQRWKVVFEDQAELEIVDETGVVVLYNNVAQQDVDESTVTASTITKDQALQRAQNVLQATDETETFSLEDVTRDRDADPTNQGLNANRYVRWSRQFFGVICRDQGACVVLQNETGAVLGVNISVASAKPASMPITVSRSQADAVAKMMCRFFCKSGLPQPRGSDFYRKICTLSLRTTI